MIDQGQSQSQFPQERLSATEIGLLSRRAEPAVDQYRRFRTRPQGLPVASGAIQALLTNYWNCGPIKYGQTDEL